MDNKELYAALVAVQSKLESAQRTADNPYFGSKYATLEDCWKACRDLLAANGLAIIQLVSGDGELVSVTTRLAHISGGYVEATLTLKPDKTGPQAAGSAITYARRYGLMAIVGLTPADDDGNAATNPPKSKSPPQKAVLKKSSPLLAE